MKLLAAHQAVLVLLLARARQARPLSAFGLACALGATVGDTLRRLRALDRAGLVDAGRVRLTLAGFAIALSLGRGRVELAA